MEILTVLYHLESQYTWPASETAARSLSAMKLIRPLARFINSCSDGVQLAEYWYFGWQISDRNRCLPRVPKRLTIAWYDAPTPTKKMSGESLQLKKH